MDLKVLFCWVFKKPCEAGVKLADIGPEKARCNDGRQMGVVIFMSVLQEEFPVGLKRVGTERVQHVLQATIGVALYYSDEERIDHMFHDVFVDNELAFEAGRSMAEVFGLKSKSSKSALAQSMSHPSALQRQLYFHPSIFLEYCKPRTLVSTLHS